ncbi:MAG TPA: ankyrin repeat domain-containing protein [Burkholderiaceae bacterium]|nr:ankyrin repeat domain-containing protein [Burkholderiaceae bacterium]
MKAYDTPRHRGHRERQPFFSSVPQCLSVSYVAKVAIALLLFCATTGAQSPRPLIDAVKRGDHAAVRTLLRDKTLVTQAAADGTTALHYAVQANDVELVNMLLAAGANVKAANRYGLRPLTLAAENGSEPVISLLLKAGADPNTTTDAGEPVLMTAARTGNDDAIGRLIAAGADVNARERWFGETALMWAAAENHAGAVQALVKAGADINARSRLVEAPVLEFPRSGGPNSPFPRGGWTAVMFAARQGAIEAARALADLGANLNLAALPQTDVPLKPEEMKSAENGVGTTALVFAIINVHYDLAAVLLEKGANPNVLDLAGMGALYAATDMNSLQWVQGRPAPILTDKLDGVDLVRLLLQKGADPDARLKTRPLKRHHDAGSTMNFGEGTTPLMRAARTGDVAVMKALLDGGANPFLTLTDGTNALLLAAGQGYGGVRGDGIRIVVPTQEDAAGAVQLLLERGVDIDSFNTAGNTALHAAIARGDAVVKVLASRHARLIKNKAGATPVDLASGAGRGGRGGAGRGAGGRGGPAPARESTLAILRQYYPEATKAN